LAHSSWYVSRSARCEHGLEAFGVEIEVVDLVARARQRRDRRRVQGRVEAGLDRWA
jgi:hypothetical protein